MKDIKTMENDLKAIEHKLLDSIIDILKSNPIVREETYEDSETGTTYHIPSKNIVIETYDCGDHIVIYQVRKDVNELIIPGLVILNNKDKITFIEQKLKDLERYTYLNKKINIKTEFLKVLKN